MKDKMHARVSDDSPEYRNVTATESPSSSLDSHPDISVRVLRRILEIGKRIKLKMLLDYSQRVHARHRALTQVFSDRMGFIKSTLGLRATIDGVCWCYQKKKKKGKKEQPSFNL